MPTSSDRMTLMRRPTNLRQRQTHTRKESDSKEGNFTRQRRRAPQSSPIAEFRLQPRHIKQQELNVFAAVGGEDGALKDGKQHQEQVIRGL